MKNIGFNKSEIVPAERISHVEEYYFSKKLKEIAEMNASGDDVINLGIGSPDLPPSGDTIDALTEMAHDVHAHGYQPYVGTPELREAFASFYKRWYGVELDPNKEVLPLMGSKEGIMHISMAFINPGDGVLIPNPGYPTYSSVSKLVGAKLISYALRQENNWMPDFEELERANDAGEIDLSRVKLMWCNYPSMPTGANGSMEIFEKLVAFGKLHNIIICHDNPYSFILNNKPISILSVPGAKDICIELNSMSKSFNMPGWRIGVLNSNAQFVSWVLRVKSNMDSGMFRGLQAAAIKALNAPKSWFDDMNKTYSDRRDLAREILENVGATVRDGQVGLFLWGKCPKVSTISSAYVRDDNNTEGGKNIAAEGNEYVRGEDICDRVLYDAHVFLTPGSIFGSEGENYIRISLCCDKETLSKALLRIKKSLKK